MSSKCLGVVITVTVSIALLAATLVAVPVSFGLANAPPSLFIGAQPTSQTVPEGGGSADFTVAVYPQGAWGTGTVSFTLVDPPNGVTATFDPAKLVDIDVGGGSTIMTVTTTADVQGTLKLTIKSEGKATPTNGGLDVPVDASADITLTIGGSTQPTNTTSTTTVTSTNSSTTTVAVGSVSTVTSFITSTLTTTRTSTLTIVSTERAQTQSNTTAASAGMNPASNGYVMFGVGALVVSSVLFVSGVLLLVSNRKHHYTS